MVYYEVIECLSSREVGGMCTNDRLTICREAFHQKWNANWGLKEKGKVLIRLQEGSEGKGWLSGVSWKFFLRYLISTQDAIFNIP